MMITTLYACLFALLFFALTVRVILMRRQTMIGVGDGGNRQLLRLMRAHANCAEYGPICLILLGLAEFGGAASWLLHALGIALIIGRTIHGINIAREGEVIALRVTGMSFTFLALLGGVTINLIQLAANGF